MIKSVKVKREKKYEEISQREKVFVSCVVFSVGGLLLRIVLRDFWLGTANVYMYIVFLIAMFYTHISSELINFFELSGFPTISKENDMLKSSYAKWYAQPRLTRYTCSTILIAKE